MDLSVKKKEDTLSVRVDQPLQGCAIEPFTLLHSYGKDRHTISGIGGSTASSKMHYRWFRSKTKRICDNPSCPKTEGFPGFSVAKLTVDPNNVDLPPHMRNFCCSECFVSVWRKSRVYRKVLSTSSRGSSKTPLLDSKTEEERMYPDPAKSETREWQLVSGNKTYVPTVDDVGHTLKIDCTAKSVVDGKTLCSNSTKTEVVLPVPDPPPPRQLVRHPEPSRGKCPIRICSYNVLAEIYANKQMYPYCPLWALSWNFRKRNLMRQMAAFDADIYCLQEVQEDRFEEFFYPSFQAKGYQGVFKKKTREPMGRKGKVDGCAVFFRASRFRLVEKYFIEFNEAAMNMARNGTLLRSQAPSKVDVHDALNRMLKGNVAQVLVMDTIPAPGEETSQRFCLCNTHIFWDPQYCDVKLWQTQVLLKELEKFHIGRNLPLVLSGDFNSLPNSSVYEYITTTRVQPMHPDLKRNPCGIISAPNEICHKISLMSSSVAVTRREPRFTNFTADFVGTLDYVFSSARIQPFAVSRVPSEEELRKHSNSPLPNLQYPSDHLALCVDFHFLDESTVMARNPMVARPTSSAYVGSHRGVAPPHASQYGTLAGHRSAAVRGVGMHASGVASRFGGQWTGGGWE